MSMPTDHHTERVQEKADAVEAIENALATIEGQSREPDLWEREFLRQAIGWLYRGGYRSAAVNAELGPAHRWVAYIAKHNDTNEEITY